MHKLDRALATRPPCLDDYDYRTQTWDDVEPCKPAIRKALEDIQGSRCAYCEGPLYDGAHIEHFRRKNQLHYPDLTFHWPNLFLSCESKAHCGHYKDRRGASPYSPNNVIKPDEDDPDDYLYFHSKGEARARGRIPPERVAKAEETIRVFHLDHPTLRADRRDAVDRYRRSRQGNVDAILEFDPQDREEFVQEELVAVASLPYASAIRHFLESVF